jgi:hypothetical protein
VGISEGNIHLRDLGIERRMLLKCISKKYDTRVWAGFIWVRIMTSVGTVVNTVMSFAGSTKYWEYLE